MKMGVISGLSRATEAHVDSWYACSLEITMKDNSSVFGIETCLLLIAHEQ